MPYRTLRISSGSSERWLHGSSHLWNDAMIKLAFSLLLLLLLQLHSCLVLAVPTMLYDLHSSSACLNQPNKTLPLTCPPQHMVLLMRAYYGHSPSGHCFPEEHHCKHELAEQVSCVGRQTCYLNLPSGGEGRPLPACNQRATYIHAEYMCVPVSATKSICQQSELISPSPIYLSTPNYPFNYPTNQHCSLRLTASFPEQRIRIFIMDLSLENNQTDCADWLHLFDGHRSETYCNTRTMVSAMVTFENWLDLTFHSREANPWKGFWIYCEVFPEIEITTSAPTTLPPTTTTTTTLEPTTLETTSSEPDLSFGGQTSTDDSLVTESTVKTQTLITHRDNDSLFVGVVVGTVLGILLCIMIALLLVVLLRRPGSKLCLFGGLPYQPGSSTSAVALNNQPISVQPVTYINNDCAQHIDFNTKTGEEQLYC